MLRPRNIEGAKAPLFDRLVDLDPKSQTESRPFRTLNRLELRESVLRELGWLLNTRCPIPVHLLYDRERSIIDYGIPNFSHLVPQSGDDQKRLAWVLSRTIDAFEPRLSGVRVAVTPDPTNPMALQFQIEANLVVGAGTEPVSFPAVIHPKTGEVRLLDG